ncbi:hypothetical protein [Bacillus mycoides]|uniref:hypothetical protein n=1 Tax=Bacillus mycoides TaxID=1405 RepID=UPI001C01639C|nr:hypothetical protein [Bacillus mycoides]QWG35143.1 hypothetical protein EXW30_20325 [Bacillus mycoides]
MEQEKGYVDLETGEKISREQMRLQLTAENESIKQEQKEGYLKALDVARNIHEDKRKFLKYSRGIASELTDLTLTDCSVLLRLSMHLYYNGGGLIKSNTAYDSNDKNALTVVDMSKITGKSRRGLIQILNRLADVEAISITKQDKQRAAYRINERFIACGTGMDMNKNHVKLYVTKTKKLIKKIPNQKQHQYIDMLTDTEAGILFKLLPYVHERNYMLCSNPTEKDTKKIAYMSVQELADAVGIKYKSFTNSMRGLVKKSVLGKFYCGITVNRGAAYVLNPKIVDCGYHMNKELGGQISELFEATENVA